MAINAFLSSKITKTLGFLLLIIAALIVSLYFYHYFFKRSLKPNQHIPDSIISDMQLIKTDLTGTMSYKFLSKIAYHYKEQDRTDFTAPLGYYYSKNQPYWKLTADQGYALQGDEIVHLLGNVYIHQDAGKNNHAVTLTTSKATLYPRQKIAENKVFVKVTEPGMLITAVGFHANMKQGKVVLLSKAKGHFIPQPKT